MKSKIFIYIFLFSSIFLNSKVLKFSDAYELSLQNAHSLKASYYKYKSMKAQISRDRAFMFPHLNLNVSLGYEYNRYRYEEPELIENPFDEPIKLPDSLTEPLPESLTQGLPSSLTTLPDYFYLLSTDRQKAYLEKQKAAQEQYFIDQKKAQEEYFRKQKEAQDKYIKEQEEYREKTLKEIEEKNQKMLQDARDRTRQKRIYKQIGISLTQTIYDRERYKILESTIIKSRQLKIQNELDRQKFATKILEYYMDILKSYTKIRLYKTFIKYHQSLLKFNEKSFKLGLIGKADVLKEKVALSSMKIDLKKERNILKIHKNELNRYLGFSDYKLPKLNVWRVNNKLLKKMSRVISNKDNIYSNLSYQIQLENIKYLQKQVEVAISGHYPKINLQASYTKYYGYGVKLKSNKSISLNLSMPIFEGGYTAAKIKSAKFDLLAAKESLAGLEKDIEISYKQYLADFKAAKNSILIYKKSYYAAKEYFKTIQKGYKKGLNSIIELYDAQNQLSDIEVKYIESVYRLLDSYINILILTNRLDSLYIIDKVLG